MEKEKLFVKDPKEIVNVGQNINVEILSGDYKGIYYSYIYDEDENGFLILQPTDNLGRAAFVRVGDIFSVSCITKKNIRAA